VADDLTEIKGIGPVYAAGLTQMGITSFRALSEAEPKTVGDTIGTSVNRVAEWIAEALQRNA
jgi:predicted flap endonuclease-1-like 5' DNA nuclease